MNHMADTHDHHAPAMVLAALCFGCVGPTRVGIMPPLDGSSPRTDPVRPLEVAAAAPQRDTSASLAVYDEGAAQGQLGLAAVLVRIFAGATAPIMSGVFGAFDEDRLFGRQGQLEPRDRPPAAAGKRPESCAAFLCGPVTRPR
jgi:hypothetical protein